MGRKAANLTSQTFSYLKVIKRVESNPSDKNAKWECQCICGKVVTTEGARLRRGVAKSCGCKRGALKISTMNTHGKTNTRLYRIWHSMKSRCDYDFKGSERYYGRGIKVCSDWNESFEKFHGWAVNNGYEDYLTIDRINSNGNYEPDNCRWADKLTQDNNRRSNKTIEINGEKRTIAEWSRVSGVKYETIRSRISRGCVGSDLIRVAE